MGIFERRKRNNGAADDEHGYEPDEDEVGDGEPDTAAEQDVEPQLGPYDAHEAPEDDVPRLDLGSVRIAVPDGVQLQLEFEDSGELQAVHLVTGVGRFTVTAYAAPRSERLWPEVREELAGQLRTDGAEVTKASGEWGEELAGKLEDSALRFLGVDGPRWMLRGIAAGPPEYAEDATMLLRDIVRASVVVRGEEPLPVRTPLPVQLPDELAEHIAEQVEAEA